MFFLNFKSRQRNNDRNDRKVKKKIMKNNILETCEKLFATNLKHNNCLIELSKKEIKRLSKNIIQLSLPKKNNDSMYYNEIKFEDSVSFTQSDKKLFENKESFWLNICKTKKKYHTYHCFERRLCKDDAKHIYIYI